MASLNSTRRALPRFAACVGLASVALAAPHNARAGAENGWINTPAGNIPVPVIDPDVRIAYSRLKQLEVGHAIVDPEFGTVTDKIGVLVIERGFPTRSHPGAMAPDAIKCVGSIKLSQTGQQIVEAAKNTPAEAGHKDNSYFPTTPTKIAPYVQAALALDAYANGKIAAGELRKQLQPVLNDCSIEPNAS